MSDDWQGSALNETGVWRQEKKLNTTKKIPSTKEGKLHMEYSVWRMAEFGVALRQKIGG